jgi:hypothetical protein
VACRIIIGTEGEVPRSILGDSVVLGDDFMAEHADRGFHQIDHAEVRDRDM